MTRILPMALVLTVAGLPSLVRADDPPKATAPRLSLAECVRVALDRQPALQARQAGVGVAAEQQKVARSYFFPQATASTRFTQLNRHVFVDIPGLTGPSLDVFGDAGAFFGISRLAGPLAANLALAQPNQPPFSTARQAALAAFPNEFQADLLGERSLVSQVLVTQPLYTGGKIRYRNEQAKVGIEAAASDIVQTRQQIVFEVHRAYDTVLLARALERVADETEGLFKAVESLAQSHIDARTNHVTPADLQRARALRLLASGRKVQAQRAIDMALSYLRGAMGVPQDEPLDVADERLTRREESLDLNTLMARAMASRPEVVKADLGVRAAELERKLAKAQFHPDVAAFGRLQQINDNRNYPNPTNPTEWAVGVEAAVPLVTGGRRLAETRKADMLFAQALAARDAVRNQVAVEVKQAYLEWREADERVGIAEKATKAAAEAIEAYHNLERNDLIAKKQLPKYFEDLELTQLLLTDAATAYHQQVFGYNLALAKVRLATGSDE